MTDAHGEPGQSGQPGRSGEPDRLGDIGPGDVPASDPGGVDDWIEDGGALAAGDESTAAGADDELVVTRIALEERTLDLQRLQAEYVNYKRRVERDRDLVRENSTYAALVPIVDVLDTIDRARESARSSGGEISDDLRTVADQLERIVSGLGLVKFGEPGDAFDPTVHEALSHLGEDADVAVATCKVVAKAGYKIGDRVVRAAQVLVVDPPA